MHGVHEIAVVGAGAWGRRLALVCAQYGHPVTLCDIDEAARQEALTVIREKFQEVVAAGALTDEEGHKALGRVMGGRTLDETVEFADLVVEAVPDSLELKRHVLAEAAAASSEGAIIVTTTSSLSVTELARAVPRPSRFLGLRFADSVGRTEDPVEVVLGPETSAETRNALEALLREVGKEPVSVIESTRPPSG